MKERLFCPRIIPVFMILLFATVGSMIARMPQKQIMEYYIYYQGDYAKYSGRQRYEQAFKTREEAEKARQKAAADSGGLAEGFLRDTYIKEVPTGRYTAAPPSTQSPAPVRTLPVTQNPVSPKPPNTDDKDILSRVKGGGVSFDGDGKDIAGRIKGGTTPVSSSGGGGGDISSRIKPGNTSTSTAKSSDWSLRSSVWIEELKHINGQIASIETALMRLKELNTKDRMLFEGWKKESNEAFERYKKLCVGVVLDFSLFYYVDNYEKVYADILKIPKVANYEALVTKYRRIAEMYKSLQATKAGIDALDLVDRLDTTNRVTNKVTKTEFLETLRDTVNVVAGLIEPVGLLPGPAKIPATALQIGCYVCDFGYAGAEIYFAWQKMLAMNASIDELQPKVSALCYQLGHLKARQEQLVRNIEAGEPRGLGAKSE